MKQNYFLFLLLFIFSIHSAYSTTIMTCPDPTKMYQQTASKDGNIVFNQSQKKIWTFNKINPNLPMPAFVTSSTVFKNVSIAYDSVICTYVIQNNTMLYAIQHAKMAPYGLHWQESGGVEFVNNGTFIPHSCAVSFNAPSSMSVKDCQFIPR